MIPTIDCRLRLSIDHAKVVSTCVTMREESLTSGEVQFCGEVVSFAWFQHIRGAFGEHEHDFEAQASSPNGKALFNLVEFLQ